MSVSPISALSPLDGRYAAKVAPLRPLLSEYGLMHRRVQVEVEWFIALSDAGFAEFKPLKQGDARSAAPPGGRFQRGRCRRPSRTSRRPPTTTSRRWSTGSRPTSRATPNCTAAAEFVHFACTSEDINNTSHALMLQGARASGHAAGAGRPDRHAGRRWRRRMADMPMLSRTHGQTASPTTLGKEVANVAARLRTARARIAAVPLRAKMNGAVGNYNAHLAAYPDFDWEAFSRTRGREAPGPGLQRATPSRSSRTTTWPNCSTPSRVPTPS